MKRLAHWLKVIWAAPCSAVGLLLGLGVFALGGSARRVDGTLEFAYRQSLAQCGRHTSLFPYRAITFGHVIVAVTEAELVRYREHERVHVRQYARWGPFFPVAYVATAVWQLFNGRRAYWDNYFEVQARKDSAEAKRTGV
ncbi:MAG TPA: signal peptide prediction [Burkholderiaceae bacterium]|nr:signal peptide prediction [Burkholderiaceae bacterium]